MKKFLLTFLLISGAARAQLFSNPIKILASDPSGACAPRTMGLSVASGNAFYCRPDTSMWSAGMGSGGTGTVTNSGTLTANAVMVGNGGVQVKASKLTCTGTPVTCTFYDDTAVTGNTLVNFRCGANQSSGGTLFNITNSSNQIVGFADCNGAIYTQKGSDGTYKQSLTAANGPNGNSLNLSSDSRVAFNSTADLHTGADDTGFCRGAAGQLNVNDGSATCSNLAVLAASSLLLGSSPPTITGTGVDALGESTGQTCAASGVDCLKADSGIHNLLLSVNNGPFVPLVATTTITTGTTATLSTPFTVNQEATAATGVTYTLPTAASGLQFCIDNGYNGSAPDTGILTFATSATGQFMVFTDGTLTATGGNVTSGGAARDGACVFGIDSTHWMFLPHSGTWTKH